MMRSLFAGVSGLKNHQTRMDVIGNNIANVNTVGFKASRVNFQDVLSQTIQGASSGSGTRGGTNPMQVGLGMGLASIDTIFTDGSFQPTGKQTDLSIKGQGFFILSDGANQIYTRAGGFDFDNIGNFLVPGTGYKVMGWKADASGNIDTTQPIGDILVPVGSTMDAKSTQSIVLANNLAADAPIGTTVPASINVYDSLGNAHSVEQLFYKVADNKWLVGTSVPDGLGNPSNRLKEITFSTNGAISSIKDVTPAANWNQINVNGLVLENDAPGTLTSFSTTVTDEGMKTHNLEFRFKNVDATHWDYEILSDGVSVYSAANQTAAAIEGGMPLPSFSINGSTFSLNYDTVNAGTTFTAPTSVAPAANILSGYATSTVPGAVTFTATGGATPMSISINYSAIKQYGNEGISTVTIIDQDGYPAGTLDSTSIDPSGIIVGKFTNGKSQNMAQVALATFNNPAGLTKVGDNLYAKSNNSGEAQVGPSGSGGRGSFNPGSLEMSNVDLAQEFSNMIITQRGFQANSKIISTVDEMLQELANLKR